MKKKVLFILFLFAVISGVKAQPYTVTLNTDTDDPGTTASEALPGELRYELSRAITDANTGLLAVVNFNVPSGLVKLKAPMNIELTKGILYMESYTGLPNQGVTIDPLYFNFSYFTTLLDINLQPAANGVSYNATVQFNNLEFKNFYNTPAASTLGDRQCINVNGNNHLTLGFTNCIFEDNFKDIYCESGNVYMLTVDHCTFTKNAYNFPSIINTANINADLSAIHFTTGILKVINNCQFNFSGVPAKIYGIVGAAVDLKIINNTFIYCKDALYSYAPTPGTNFSFSNNTMTYCSAGCHLIHPSVNYILDGNWFAANVIDIRTSNSTEASLMYQPYGLKLIKSFPSLGYSTGFNANNHFNFTTPFSTMSYNELRRSFNCPILPQSYTEIIGYTEISPIYLPPTTSVKGPIARANTTTTGPQTLIFRTNQGGCMLPYIVITPTAVSISPSNIFSITFTTSISLPSDNDGYALDIYTNNTVSSPGILEGYAGAIYFNSNGTNTYTLTAPVQNLDLSCGDRIIVTITSLGGIASGTYQQSSPITLPVPACPTSPGVAADDNEFCIDQPVTFNSGFAFDDIPCIDGTFSYAWNLGDGTFSSDATPQHVYTTPGPYTVSLTATGSITTGTTTTTCSLTPTLNINVTDDCCPTCLPSFEPIPGKKYVFSAWVSETTTTKSSFDLPQAVITYSLSGTGTAQLGPFKAKGQVIDGWQRIDEVFMLPPGATAVNVILENSAVSGEDVFFDDVRIHPFDASFKSFVYDPVTLRFVAELDNNNYATFYEYDDEGKLTRVKKETEKHVMTVKESRSSSPKK
ncbi:MAG: hypothetical protein K0S33_3754 [Bacteroidetes bacterium]|jgi:hypothetical protein|nr:hypothetical protein [Bacteroidota bacterium]